MIRINIERLDKPKSFTFTNTGLREYIPVKEEFYGWSDDPLESLDLDYKSVYLEYDEDWDWDLHSPELGRMLQWYIRSYFSTAKELNIDIRVEK